MKKSRQSLVILVITQEDPTVEDHVSRWDWSTNNKENEHWQLVLWAPIMDGCVTQIPADAEAKPAIPPANPRVLEAAEYAAEQVEAKEAPPSMPQAVTMDDFPANSDDKPIAEYTDPADYLERTGKRFRMTKDQKDRGLSREDAVSEFLGSLDS